MCYLKTSLRAPRSSVGVQLEIRVPITLRMFFANLEFFKNSQNGRLSSVFPPEKNVQATSVRNRAFRQGCLDTVAEVLVDPQIPLEILRT